MRTYAVGHDPSSSRKVIAATPGESTRQVIVLGTILLLAFALRLWGLTVQGLWYDEGFSVRLAGQSWAQILVGELNLPPLYHLLLGAWVRLAGSGEFAVRFFSVCWGLLGVGLGGMLATRLLNRRAGAFTALLLAVSPIKVWYAQETRMYAMLGALTLASSYLLARLLSAPSGCDRRSERERPGWAFYALVNIAAVYTHYYAALVLAGQAVWVLLHLIRYRDRKTARAWLLAQAGLMLALLPWLPVLWGQWRAANTTYWPGQLSLQFVVQNTLLGFAGAGLTISNEAAWRLAAPIVSLAALGIVVGLAGRSQRWGTLALLALLLVPFAAFYVLVRDRPKFSPRYLLPVVPPLLALAAGGLAALWPSRPRRCHEWGGIGLALLAAGSMALASADVATAAVRDASLGRDDLRGAAAFLSQAVGSNEAVILLSGHIEPAFRYYYAADNCYPIPPVYTPSPSVDDVLGPGVLDDLNQAIAGRQGAWLVLWQDEVVDPNNLVLTAFDLAATEVSVTAGFRGLRLRHYVFAAGTRLEQDMFSRTPLNVGMGDGEVVLVGGSLPADPVPAGQEAIITLLWQATRAIDDEYRLSLRIFDEQGEQRSQADGRLAGFMYPTSRWRPGFVVGSHRVPLPIDLPPGDYDAQVLVYRHSDGSNWTVHLGRFQVGRALRRPAPAELGIEHALSLRLGEFELLGYRLSPKQATLGQAVHMTLFLRAHERPRGHYRLAIWLAGQAWQEFALPASAADMQPGDVIAVQYPLVVPRAAPAGAQPLAVALQAADGQEVAPPQLIGELGVAASEHLFVVPPDLQNPQHFTLGETVRFLGYGLQGDLLHPGKTLHLTLYWQCLQAMDTSYTVFVHVLDGESKIWGQVDRIPGDAARPTTGWLPGEVIVDSYQVPVRPDASPGRYVIEVGLYDATTGARLPVRDQRGRLMADDRILLTSLELR